MLTNAFQPFRYRDYRLFWVAGAFSNIGMWALVAGRLWLMHDLTRSPFMLGVVVLAGGGPFLLLTLLGGVVADNTNRLKMVIFTRSGFAILAFLTCVLVFSNLINPTYLILISISTGILLAFDLPSRQAMLEGLVPKDQLVNAVAVYSIVTAGSAIIGPSLFAPLVNFWGIGSLFGLIGFMYALTVLLLSLIKTKHIAINQKTGTEFRRGILDGVSYTFRHRGILLILSTGIGVGMCGLSFETLLPVFAEEVFHGNVYAYGSLLLSIGIGGTIGTLFLSVMVGRSGILQIHYVSGIGLACFLIIFSFVEHLQHAYLAVGLIGMCSVIFLTSNSTTIQKLVDDKYRGRVMSLHQMTWGSTALGGFVVGAIAQSTSAPFSVKIAGSLVLLIIIFSLLARIRGKTSH